jgi:hypothetical protein
MNEEKSALTGRRAGERSCPRCGAVFVCGNEAGAASCWCAELPPVLPVPGAGGGCYCPACLREVIERQEAMKDQAGRKS